MFPAIERCPSSEAENETNFQSQQRREPDSAGGDPVLEPSQLWGEAFPWLGSMS